MPATVGPRTAGSARGRGGGAGKTGGAPRSGGGGQGAVIERLRPNQRRTLEVLAQSGGQLPRPVLAQLLGLPKATLAGLVTSLVALGLVEESVDRSERRRPGRPPATVALTGPPPATGAVLYSEDVVQAALVSPAGAILGRASHSAALPPTCSIGDLASAVVATVREAALRAGASAGPVPEVVLGLAAPVGISAPAPGHTDGPVQSAGLPGVLGRPHDIYRELAARSSELGGASVTVENDANLGALGEAAFGAGRGLDTFIYLKLARGVGAGVVVGRRLHRGVTGFAGELGHVQVADDGPLCLCGGRGCLRGLLGEALVRAVQPAYERALTFRDVLELAAGGDAGPNRVLEDLGRGLGRPLADFVTFVNPAAIVVDSRFAPAMGPLTRGIREAIDHYAAPFAARAVSVLPGSLGDDAELLGAAVLARRAA